MALVTITAYAGVLDTPYDPDYSLDLVAQAERLSLQDEVERLNGLVSTASSADVEKILREGLKFSGLDGLCLDMVPGKVPPPEPVEEHVGPIVTSFDHALFLIRKGFL